MTPKEKKEKRRTWWKIQFQAVRLWLWCVGGIALVLLLPGLQNGIAGISLYVPSLLEVGVALALGFVGVVADENLGGIQQLAKTPSAWNRKRRHAFIIGVGILTIIERLME